MSTSRASRAVVVGSGPNGLAGAVALARAGVHVTVLEAASTIGGGTRSASDLTVPGVLHDLCSAIHPFGVASPFLAALPLAEHGLRWARPEIDLAHPLDDGSCGVLAGDVDRTASGLGADADAWRRVFGPPSRHLATLAPQVLGPILRMPWHPVRMAGFGARALMPATVLARAFSTPQAAALFLGCAAHVYRPLTGPATSSVGVMLIAAAHRHGWPVAVGGSQAITAALESLLVSLGGEVVVDHPVRSWSDLPTHDVALFDVAPPAFAAIAGSRQSGRLASRYRGWRWGPGAFKVDLAVRGGVPWTAEPARRAGTVHVGGDAATMVAAEQDASAGRLPERPFVLVGQQYLADPSRSVGDVHPVWAYAHVPNGYAGDATDLVIDQLERYAPGLRSRIVAQASSGPPDLERYNPNYGGGDIGTGRYDVRQLVGRPVLAADPYATGVPGAYLCSAATAPGAGVHGMCGFHAARSALRFLGAASLKSPASRRSLRFPGVATRGKR